MRGDVEQLQRWAKFAREGAKRAQSYIRKAQEILGHLDSACIRGDLQKALELKAKATERVMQALGACLNPQAPHKEAYELAVREFEKNRSIAVANRGGHTGARSVNDNTIRIGHAREGSLAKGDYTAITKKAETLATEILVGRSLGIPSEDIVAGLAEGGYDANRIAGFYGQLLEEVFSSRECSHCGRRGGSSSMKEKVLKTFLEWKRSMEPKAIFEIESDLDNLDESALREIQERLTPLVLDNLLQKDEK